MISYTYAADCLGSFTQLSGTCPACGTKVRIRSREKRERNGGGKRGTILLLYISTSYTFGNGITLLPKQESREAESCLFFHEYKYIILFRVDANARYTWEETKLVRTFVIDRAARNGGEVRRIIGAAVQCASDHVHHLLEIPSRSSSLPSVHPSIHPSRPAVYRVHYTTTVTLASRRNSFLKFPPAIYLLSRLSLLWLDSDFIYV